jgi:hypothetical protein
MSGGNFDQLAEALAERVACRLAEMLRERDEGPRMLSATEVGRRLGRSAEWVRDHRDELGVVSLGDGPRPRLSFPSERVEAYLACSSGRRTEEPENGSDKPTARRRARAPAGRESQLLPVRGKAPRP